MRAQPFKGASFLRGATVTQTQTHAHTHTHTTHALRWTPDGVSPLCNPRELELFPSPAYSSATNTHPTPPPFATAAREGCWSHRRVHTYVSEHNGHSNGLRGQSMGATRAFDPSSHAARRPGWPRVIIMWRSATAGRPAGRRRRLAPLRYILMTFFVFMPVPRTNTHSHSHSHTHTERGLICLGARGLFFFLSRSLRFVAHNSSLFAKHCLTQTMASWKKATSKQAGGQEKKRKHILELAIHWLASEPACERARQKFLPTNQI